MSRQQSDTVALGIGELRARAPGMASVGQSVGLLICLFTATRLSEMLALTWGGDLDGDCLHIWRSMVKDTQQTKATKTEDERFEPCPAVLVDVLAEWKILQEKEFKAKGLRQSGETPIVSSKKGDPCTQDDFREVVSSEQGADVPARGFHDPRIAPHRHDHPAEGHQGGHDDHHEHHGSQDDADAATLLACGRQHEAAAMDAFNSLLAPDSDEARYRNCAIWTVCPGNSGVGACWSAAHGDSVRATAGMMACDTDAFRLRG